MKIFMVRHGQTDSNTAKRIMGQRIDESLNEEGKRQSEGLAKGIQDMTFDVIFSSPLKRAAETAGILGREREAQIVHRDELKERDFGSLSGMTWAEAVAVAKRDLEEFRMNDRGQKYDYRPWGGESAEDVKKRLLDFVGEIKKEYAGKSVLIVAHSGIVRLAHHLFRKQRVEQIHNASIEEFEI